MKILNIIKIIIMAEIFNFVLPLYSQNIIRPQIQGPNDIWVNSYSGVLLFGKTYMVTQNSEMPMQLRFYYNSSSNKKNYGYGLGFSFEYEMRYSIEKNGNVIIETGDGRRDTYKRMGDEYVSSKGVFSKLKEYEYNKFVLTQKTGEKYYFDDAKHRKITKIEDRHGSKTILNYNENLLMRIEDAAGHVIKFKYSDGLLFMVKSNFHKGNIKYFYDNLQRLIKCKDAMGYCTLYGYDKKNRINEITDANGHKTFISYNHAGMVSNMKTSVSNKSIRYEGDKTVIIDYTKPKNRYSYYRWDGEGRIVESGGLCCGFSSTLQYDDDDNVIRRTDAKGNVYSYTYDDRGNMLSMTDPLGYTEYYTYESKFNLLSTFKDKSGNIYRYEYNSKGDMVSFNGPLGLNETFTYNDKGWCLTHKDSNNNVYVTNYNPDGTISKITNAAGFHRTFTYDDCGIMLSTTDARNNTTYYAFNNNDLIISQTDALGNTKKYGRDKVGNIVRFINEKNQITAYSYDALGNIKTLTDPLGGKYVLTRDGCGNLLSIQDPMGNVKNYVWNENNKLQEESNAMGEKTLYDYDANGNIVTVTEANGNVISYFYDNLDRVLRVSDNMGVIAQYIYDANGNILQLTDGLGRTLTYEYDALERTISVSLPSGDKTKMGYDSNSNLIYVEDALGHVVQNTYNSLNKKISYKDALGAMTNYDYDENGNLLKTIDAKGHVTSYTYDALNRNTVVSFANGTFLQYAYDALGNTVFSKDRSGNEFRYEYNVLNNMILKRYPDGTTDTYTYDALGGMMTAVNKDAKISLLYDKSGRLISETLNGKTIKYNYDVAKGINTIVYPDGTKVDRILNARNLISSIFENAKEIVTVDYNVTGQKIKESYSNGITTFYGYNKNGSLETIKDNRNVLHLKMEYDKVGNLIKRHNLLQPERTETYGYDANLQLVHFSRGKSIEVTYELDLLGNRIRKLENGVETKYASNNVNAYTSISGQEPFIPKYDGNENLLFDGKHDYVYDYNDKLVNVDGSEILYRYDALGRIISKNNTSYYYNGFQKIMDIKDNVSTSYIYGNNIDEIIHMCKEKEEYWYHTNNIGSTMAITDKNGMLKEQVDYDTYGLPSFIDADNKNIKESLIGNNILFTGREYEPSLQIYDYRSRHYSPDLGRFNQKDVLGYVDGPNDYNYVRNNPVLLKDPLGLESEESASTRKETVYIIACPLGADFFGFFDNYLKNPKELMNDIDEKHAKVHVAVAVSKPFKMSPCETCKEVEVKNIGVTNGTGSLMGENAVEFNRKGCVRVRDLDIDYDTFVKMMTINRFFPGGNYPIYYDITEFHCQYFIELLESNNPQQYIDNRINSKGEQAYRVEKEIRKILKKRGFL